MQAMAVNSNWLDTTTAGSSSCPNISIGWPYETYHFYYPYTYQVISSPARPIKLTLSEVEQLRTAARKDKKLKEILQKFTDQIEITVDFGD